MYKPINPHWFYSFLDIPKLDVIREELINVKRSDVRNWSRNNNYYNISAKDILPLCPELSNYLQNVKLYEKTDRLLFSMNMSNSSDYCHVDTYEPIYCTHSLNLPLIDCTDSYTCWYSTKNKELIDATRFNLDPQRNFAICHMSEAEEIKRVEVTRPMIVNTTILHKGEAKTDSRLICGIRFKVPLGLSDMVNLGVKSPFIQVD